MSSKVKGQPLTNPYEDYILQNGRTDCNGIYTSSSNDTALGFGKHKSLINHKIIKSQFYLHDPSFRPIFDVPDLFSAKRHTERK